MRVGFLENAFELIPHSSETHIEEGCRLFQLVARKSVLAGIACAELDRISISAAELRHSD
jgi:hypothetical protein